MKPFWIFLMTNQSVKIGTYDISFELQTKSSSDVKVSAVLTFAWDISIRKTNKLLQTNSFWSKINFLMLENGKLCWL